jgi:hypothetical protein
MTFLGQWRFVMRRSRVSKRKSRKLFSRTARSVHPRNIASAPMRGGIRM